LLTSKLILLMELWEEELVELGLIRTLLLRISFSFYGGKICVRVLPFWLLFREVYLVYLGGEPRKTKETETMNLMCCICLVSKD
jgi:hypothetical protein